MKNGTLRKIVMTPLGKLLPKHTPDEADARLTRLILRGRPFMAARFGAVEIKAMLYSLLPWPLGKVFRKWAVHDMNMNAGFFPANDETLRRFARLMLESMKELDVLASWRPEEIYFKKRLSHAYKIPLGTVGGPGLPPAPNAWTKALKGKKLLVVSPFADSIASQYSTRRSKLFGKYSDDVMPPLQSLETVKAVQTIAGNRGGWKDWFEALQWMENEISGKDFDVALIGCGAYGFPLAAYVKRLGKQAIHVGGSLQLYFGIKGKRWDNSGLYNEYWISPSDNERPKNLEKVEGGCYW